MFKSIKIKENTILNCKYLKEYYKNVNKCRIEFQIKDDEFYYKNYESLEELDCAFNNLIYFLNDKDGFFFSF